jgi:hypothetical protein
MIRKILLTVVAALACGVSTDRAQAQDCSGPPLMFNSSMAELEGPFTVKAGKGCRFYISNIPGMIKETVIVQKPKVGLAGVQGTSPYYVAKPGYQGQDEFTYSVIGNDQYGGPMRVTVKRRITVVP